MGHLARAAFVHRKVSVFISQAGAEDVGLGQVCDGVICVVSVQLLPRNSELMEMLLWV
jgi:hypothetical protein